MSDVSTEYIVKVYGFLEITDVIRKHVKNHSYLYAVCTCVCGNVKEIQLYAVRTGATKSCGCLSAKLRAEKKCTHGMSNSPEYTKWLSMKARCDPAMIERYPYHAGKGIQVCDRWVDSFENFYEDLGKCPDGYTLDRINNNQDYTPENTRWVSKSLQVFNREMGKIAGVTFRKDRNKWLAVITKDFITHHLGLFIEYEDAVAARLEAEKLLYGEYSAKNFMMDGDVCNFINNKGD